MFDWLGFKISRTCGHPTPKNAYKIHLKMLESWCPSDKSPRRAARLGIILMVFCKNCRKCYICHLLNECFNYLLRKDEIEFHKCFMLASKKLGSNCFIYSICKLFYHNYNIIVIRYYYIKRLDIISNYYYYIKVLI